MRLASLLALLPLAAAAPTKRQIDTSQHCGQWDVVTAGSTYSLLLDQWGAGSAESGQSCAQLTSASGSTVAWRNAWTWTGGSGVKSFTNMQLDTGLNKQLSAIGSIPVSRPLSAGDVCGALV